METKPTPLPPLREERCPTCKGLLFRARLPPGSEIEIVCRSCRHPKPVIVIKVGDAA